MKVDGMQMSDNSEDMLKWVYELVVIIVIACCLCIINKDSGVKDSSGRIWVFGGMKLWREVVYGLSVGERLVMVVKCMRVWNGMRNLWLRWMGCIACWDR